MAEEDARRARSWRNSTKDLEGPHAVINLPAPFPSWRGERQPLSISKVRRADDLPQRLFMGSLKQYTPIEGGWEALYGEGGHAWTRLRREGNLLMLTDAWHDVPAPLGYTGDDWLGLAKLRSVGFPAKWNELAARLFENEYNIRYLPVSGDAAVLCGFPDGFMMTVAVPVAVKSLESVRRLIGTFNTQFELHTNAFACVSWCAVNYVVGRNPNVEFTRNGLARKFVNETGMPLTHLPEIETASNGSQAATVRGFRYLLVVSCVWRELESVLAGLAKVGLIAPAVSGGYEEGLPTAPEYAALIFQAGLEFQTVNFSYLDASGTRRTTYQDFAGERLLAEWRRVALNAESEEEIRRKINEVEDFSTGYLSRFNAALMT